MTELKPCPFCGSDPEIMTSSDGFTSIGCLRCNPLFGVMVQHETREKAVEVWNTRADDRSEAAAYWRRLYEETVLERTCELEPLDAFYTNLNLLNQTEWGVCSSCGTASPIDATYCCECGRKVER